MDLSLALSSNSHDSAAALTKTPGLESPAEKRFV